MDIHVYLTGRLGNQLFQYAFARSIQEKYGGKIYCNIYELVHRSEKAKHIPGKFVYDMSNYKLNENVIIEDVPLPWYADFTNPFIRVIKKVIPKKYFYFMAKKGFLLWQRNDYIDMPILTTKCVILNGWWQDIGFFHEIEEVLAKEIVPKTVEVDANKELYNIEKESDSVCISIRGGNYLVPIVKERLFVCDKDYFYNAVKEIREKVANPVFIIFSDDLEWVKSYIAFEQKFPDCKFYYESGHDSVEEKIRLMTRCKHFIISNSTFSWWAQYLSHSENKIVIAPDSWYTDGSKNGLYMENWTLLPVKKNK